MPRTGSTDSSAATALNAIAVAFALAAGAYLALVRAGAEETVTRSGGEVVSTARDGVSDPGLGLVGVAVAVVAAIPLLLRRRDRAALARRLLAVGILAFSLIGAMSIGLLFVPAGVAMLAAALTSPR